MGKVIRFTEQDKQRIIKEYDRLVSTGMNRVECARQAGAHYTSIIEWKRPAPKPDETTLAKPNTTKPKMVTLEIPKVDNDKVVIFIGSARLIQQVLGAANV